MPDAANAKAIQPPHDRAALIKLDGPIDALTLTSVQRRVDEARKADCALIIYDIDATGGLLTAALALSQFNKKLDLPTVALIHPAAYSAGAVVALSCQQIVMEPNASLGDCGAIALTDGAAGAGESPLLEELEDSARLRHWNPLLVRAMVVRGTEVFELRQTVTGEAKFVNAADRDRLLRETLTTPEGKTLPAWRLLTPPTNTADQILTVTVDPAQSGTNAIRLGFAKAQVASTQELLAVLNVRQQLLPMDYSPLEKLARWVAEPGVRGLLFLIMLVLAYIEFSHPGATLPGVGALVCLALLVGVPYATGLAHGWEIILILLGVVIIVADLLAYGGVGLLAVPGFILVAIGIVASFVPTEPGRPWIPQMSGTYVALQTGLSVVIFGTIAAVVIFFLLAHYLHMTPGLRRLQLSPAAAAPLPVVSDVLARQVPEAVFVGALGKVAADLHPAGKVRFGEHLVDAITQGQFITAGSVVEVIEIAGHNVIVQAQST